MRGVALVLACLACAGHADPSSQSKLASLLQSLDPVAFNPSSPGASSPAQKPSISSRARLGSSPPVVGRSSVVKGSDVVDPTAAEYVDRSPYDEETRAYLQRSNLGTPEDFLTVKAERWNGRHAMFGWFALAATAYIKSHGGFPDGDKLLTYEEWGSLTQTGFGGSVTQERAVIMIAHIHLLVVSLCSAVSPPGMIADTLFDGPGVEPEEPYGPFPPFQTGLTAAAEMWNGRMAMLGITAAVISSYVTGRDILEVIDICTGGLLLSGKDIR